jgi:glycosyltransferase involved in cell wall biosynthesis
MMTRKAEAVDVLVVCSGETMGVRRSEIELLDALRRLGLRVASATTDYGWVGQWRLSLNLIDLSRAVSIRRMVSQAVRRTNPRVILYTTGTAPMLEPTSRLRRAGIKFDSLAFDNRPGRRHLLQRLLQRRVTQQAALMLPMSAGSAAPSSFASSASTVVLPTPVDPHEDTDEPRQRVAVCYAGAPAKKGLDLIVRAWALARIEEAELVVTGVDEAIGRDWLQQRGVDVPPGVRWCGPLESREFRSLISKALVYVSAARYEDYGIAQLEALADGALLVTSPSAGPYEALALARDLYPGLVAGSHHPEALAAALVAAFGLGQEEQIRYRQLAAEAVRPYSRREFRRRLEELVLPELMASAGARTDNIHGARLAWSSLARPADRRAGRASVRPFARESGS